MSYPVVFLDRDGVINEMIYNKEHGYVDSPSTANQFKLIKGVPQALKKLQRLGFKIIIISNQPGIAKGYFSEKTFEKIKMKMEKEFLKWNISINDQLYCLHHPNAKKIKYKKRCTCRKPGIKLIKNAEKQHNLDLKKSFFVGDGIVDMLAAKKANCRSIFIGNINRTITKIFSEKNIMPEYIAKDLKDAVCYIGENK